MFGAAFTFNLPRLLSFRTFGKPITCFQHSPKWLGFVSFVTWTPSPAKILHSVPRAGSIIWINYYRFCTAITPQLSRLPYSLIEQATVLLLIFSPANLNEICHGNTCTCISNLSFLTPKARLTFANYFAIRGQYAPDEWGTRSGRFDIHARVTVVAVSLLPSMLEM